MREDKRNAVIYDLDGVLADSYEAYHLSKDNTGFFNPEIFHKQDIPVIEIGRLMALYFHDKGYLNFVVTARHGTRYNKFMSALWIMNKGIPIDGLFMRPEYSNEPDYLVKQQIYLNEFKPKYNTLLAIDDSKACVDMYFKLGLSTVFMKSKYNGGIKNGK